MANDYISQKTKLIINRLTLDKYLELSSQGQIISSEIYQLKDTRLNAHGMRVTNVASPQVSSDAVNKSYVDDNFSKVTITDPSLGLDKQHSNLNVAKVTLDEYKEILENHTQQELSDTLFVVSSDIMDAFNERIVNVATPISASDAATKAYVDDKEPALATSATYGIVKPDNTTISVNNGIITAIGGGSGGYSFDIYHPTYDSANNLYVLKSGKFNIINERVKNNCNLIFEDYSLNNIYKVALSTVSNTSCAINLLVDTTVNGVAGAYEDDITEQLKVLSPNQGYSFEVSYGNVIVDNDSPLYSLRNMTLIKESEDAYGYGDYWYNIYPVNESLNTVTLSSGVTPLKYALKIPGAQVVNGTKKSRDFTVKFKGDRGSAPVDFPDVDLNGKTISYEVDEETEFEDLLEPDSEYWYYSFTETEENVFLVGMRNLKKGEVIPDPLPYFTYDANRIITGLVQDESINRKFTFKYGEEEYTDWRLKDENKTFTDEYAAGIGYRMFDNVYNGEFGYGESKSPKNVSLPNATGSIGYGAFYACDDLISINLPEAMGSIGMRAFWLCSNLTTVSFPKVTSIDKYAFQECNRLSSVSLPKVTSIGDGAFYNCYNLTTLSLNSMTKAQVQAGASGWGLEPGCTVTCSDGTITIDE